MARSWAAVISSACTAPAACGHAPLSCHSSGIFPGADANGEHDVRADNVQRRRGKHLPGQLHGGFARIALHTAGEGTELTR
jgi:hypothetical protein